MARFSLHAILTKRNIPLSESRRKLRYLPGENKSTGPPFSYESVKRGSVSPHAIQKKKTRISFFSESCRKFSQCPSVKKIQTPDHFVSWVRVWAARADVAGASPARGILSHMCACATSLRAKRGSEILRKSCATDHQSGRPSPLP